MKARAYLCLGHRKNQPKGRLVSTLALMTAMVTALYGCRTNDQAGSDHARGDRHEARVDAGDFIRSITDIDTYTLTLEEHDLTIQLLDRVQTEVGQIAFFADGTHVEAVLTDRRGEVASYMAKTAKTYTGDIEFSNRYLGDGYELEITGVVSVDGVLSDLHYAWGRAGQPAAHRLTVYVYGTPTDEATVQAWIENTGLIELKDRPLALLYAITMDPAFQRGLGQLAGLEHGSQDHVDHDHHGVGTTSQEIHTSPLCSNVLPIVLGVGVPCCSVCVPALIGTGFSLGALSPLAVLTCYCCAGSVGLVIFDLVACLVDFFNRTTVQDCINECNDWENCGLESDEHSCWHECDETKCENYHGGDTGAYCSGNQCYPPPTSCSCGGHPIGSSWCDSFCCYTCNAFCEIDVIRCAMF